MAKGDFPTPERKKKIEHYYRNKIKGVELLLDNVWDPHNAAAILRTMDGLGIEKANLHYTYNEFPNLKNVGKKSSSSANKWIKFEKVGDLKDFVKTKKKEGFKIIGTEMNDRSKNLASYRFPKKCIIAFGNEMRGLSQEVKDLCDDFIFIPMVGMVESYNVSVSAAIVIYELFRQRGGKLEIKFKKD